MVMKCATVNIAAMSQKLLTAENAGRETQMKAVAELCAATSSADLTLLDEPGERFKTSPTGHQYERVLPYTLNQYLERKAIVHIAGRGAAEIGVAVTSALERQSARTRRRPRCPSPRRPRASARRR